MFKTKIKSYFSVFFVSYTTKEKIMKANEAELFGDQAEPKAFTTSQENELLKASLMLECSCIFDDFWLRIFLRDIVDEDLRKKNSDIVLIKRIINIMKQVLATENVDQTCFDQLGNVAGNLKLTVGALRNLTLFRFQSIKDELSEEEKTILINFAFYHHIDIETSKED
jgi:hypothetical protein